MSWAWLLAVGENSPFDVCAARGVDDAMMFPDGYSRWIRSTDGEEAVFPME